jgi:hypothetical protein
MPLCSMCSRIGALPGLRLVFRDYIRTAGAAVVMDEHKVGVQVLALLGSTAGCCQAAASQMAMELK